MTEHVRIIADFTDGLMQMDADGQPVPAIAESYDLSEDGTVYTFHLREDAVWSNGDPVTAADFVFGWQRAVDPAVASEYAYMLSDIGQVQNAAEIIAGEMDKSELGIKALDAYEPAATAFHLTKNPDYYNADSVQLAGLNYQVIQDSQQALMSYQTGDLDITLVNGEQVDQVKDDPEFTTIGAGYLWYVSPNMDAVPELANLNIRLAMTFALDREAITQDVLKDGSTPAYTAVPPQFAAGPDGSDFAEDQTRYADDAPQKVAQVLKEQWETTLPGLTVNLVIEPKKQRVEDMQNGNFQIGLTRWGPDYADPMTYLSMWVTGNSNNYGLWSNAEYDAIIAECTTGDLCTDAEGRWARLYDAEKIVMDEAVIFPLYAQCNAEMVSSNVSGIEFHPVALNRVYKNAVKAE